MIASIDFNALSISLDAFFAVYAVTIAAMAIAIYFACVASEALASKRMEAFVKGCKDEAPRIRIGALAVVVASAAIVASAGQDAPAHERMIVRPDPDQCVRYEARTAKDGRGYVVALIPGERAQIIQWTRKGEANAAAALAATLNA